MESKNNNIKSLFIAWTKYQRRASSMQPFFKYKLEFIGNKFDNKKYKILDYLLKSIKSLYFLRSNTLALLWIQLPPTPLLNLVLLYKRYNKKVILIADCHNGLYGKKWGKYLNGAKSLNKVDLIITHNRVIRDLAVEMGVDPNKLCILETKPAYKSSTFISNYKIEINNPWIMMPCSFAEDEPLSVVFDAARQIPEITILISGNSNRAKGIHDLRIPPSNIKLIGYLSKDDYESIFLQADAILGLTTEYHVQLSVANEATGFEKPMILSDTPILRELFNKGSIYVDTFDPTSLANGIREAILKKEKLTEEVKILKMERNIRWNEQAQGLKNRIAGLI